MSVVSHYKCRQCNQFFMELAQCESNNPTTILLSLLPQTSHHCLGTQYGLADLIGIDTGEKNDDEKSKQHPTIVPAGAV